MKKIDEIVASCIQLLENNETDIETCLAKYPEHKDELVSILTTYSNLKSIDLPKFNSLEKENAKKRLLNLIPDNNKPVTKSKAFRPNNQKDSTVKQRRNAMSWIMIASIILASLAGGTGTVLAAQEALPGDGLYAVKTAVQNIRLAFSDDEGDVGLQLIFMDENLDDIEQLIAEGRYDDAMAGLKVYEGNLAGLSSIRERIRAMDPDLGEQLQEQIHTRLETQTQLMQKIQLQTYSSEQLQNKLKETIRVAENGMGYGPGLGGEPLKQNDGEDSNGNGNGGKPEDSGNGSGSNSNGSGNGKGGGGN